MSRYRENTDDSEEVMDCIDMPSKYNVFLLNDDYTTMDFVVEILKTVFHKSQSNAESIMLSIHKNGKGLCGTYVFEVAETKVAVVKRKAKEAQFPLRCTMEEA